VRQVLLNLGGNAVKFTASGEISLAVKVLESSPVATLVRFEVHDTGIGIPAERLGALFQPFSQIDASTTRRFGGTGLGLSIVRRLVELMDGASGVESREDVGSSFWFTARFGTSAMAPGAGQPRALVELANRRVLAVDDNETNRKILAAQLELAGMQATCASGAAQALDFMRAALARGQPYEIALLDYDMPDCHGADLGLQINADPALRTTRLIMLTSSGKQGEARASRNSASPGTSSNPWGSATCSSA